VEGTRLSAKADVFGHKDRQSIRFNWALDEIERWLLP
jgi:hypothetical protein